MRGPGSGRDEKRRAGVNEDKKGRRARIVFRSPARRRTNERVDGEKSQRRGTPHSQQTLQAALGGVRACVLLLAR